MSVTIKDVAEVTGLSLSTISKYMNGGTVRSYNGEKIDKAIDELGFSPNAMARGLRASKSFSIGLVIPFLKDEYQACIASKFENLLQAAGYTMVLCCHRDDVKLANESLRFLAERKVDGVVFNALPSNQLNFEVLQQQDIPLVIYEQRIHPEVFDCINVDNCTGAYQAVEHLVKQGYKRIATITGDLKNNTAVERFRGYKRVLEDYSIPYDPNLVFKGLYDVTTGYLGFDSLWKLKDKPDAIFIANYHMCVGVMSAIQRLGIHIPSEIAIVTFDDMDFSQLVNPTLTSVKQPLDELVEVACRILFKRISGEHGLCPQYFRIKPSLIIRESTPIKSSQIENSVSREYNNCQLPDKLNLKAQSV